MDGTNQSIKQIRSIYMESDKKLLPRLVLWRFGVHKYQRTQFWHHKQINDIKYAFPRIFGLSVKDGLVAEILYIISVKQNLDVKMEGRKLY